MKTTKFIFLVLFVGVFFSLNTGCKKKEITPPDITTNAVRFVSHNGAFCGGNLIAHDNIENATSKGLCWGTSVDPTISDNHSEDVYRPVGSGVGPFDIIINNLLPSTTYYARSYGTNSDGTAYGSSVSFTTLAAPPSTITDIDGNTYTTIVIGNQVWLQTNLNVLRYSNGDSISLWTVENTLNTLTTEKYFNVANDVNNAATYGRLYNYYAATDSRKIAPAGWHVPTEVEFDLLASFVGGGYVNGFYVAGSKLKEAGIVHWAAPNSLSDNSSGFTALPADTYIQNNSASFWASTVHDDGTNQNGNALGLSTVSEQAYMGTTGKGPKFTPKSIRLVRDYAQ